MEIEIKSLDDLQKAYEAMKKELEEKGAENVKNFEEKMTAIEAGIKELKEAKPEVTAEELKAMKEDAVAMQRQIDLVDIRVKNQKGSNYAPQQAKTLDERIVEAVESSHDQIAKFNNGEIKKLAIELKSFEKKVVGAISIANVTGDTAHWSAQGRSDIIMNQNRMTHVRSLLPTRSFGPATDYYFMRENGVGEGAPAPVAEATLKAQFDIDLIEDSVKFETIAGWMLISRKAMKNIPGIAGFLQRRLPEKLYNVEDQQILYGNGTSPQIEGILDAGNFTASTSSATVLVEAILDDISLLEDTYERIATGIVMRPANYWSFFANKASGSGEYDLPQGVVFVNGVLYCWGIPVAKTTALIAGDYIVGDFQNGAELLIQEGVRIEFFEQDSTNVRTNQITVRIEETVALPVYGDTYFIKGAVPAES